MKKTYISPAFVMVKLAPSASVLTVVSTPNVSLNISAETSSLDVNEYRGVDDVNLWDEEW